MNEQLILYNNPNATITQTLIWEQGENNSHIYDIVVNDQTNQPISLDGCSVALIFEMTPGQPIQIATSVSGYIATAKIPGEATQKPGKYAAWVQVIDPAQSRDIRTNSLTIIVKANPLDIPPDTAEPYFGELAQLILDAQKAINDIEKLIPVSIQDGGTGATTAEQARENLNAAAKDHTHSLDSESITGVLPISKGGMGVSTLEDIQEMLGLIIKKGMSFTYDFLIVCGYVTTGASEFCFTIGLPFKIADDISSVSLSGITKIRQSGAYIVGGADSDEDFSNLGVICRITDDRRNLYVRFTKGLSGADNNVTAGALLQNLSITFN